MKVIRVVAGTALLFLLASPVTVFAQKDDHSQGDNHDAQQKQPDQARHDEPAAPAQHQQQAPKPEKQVTQAQPASNDQQQPKPVAQSKPAQKPAQKNEQVSSQHATTQHAAQAQKVNTTSTLRPMHPQRSLAEQQTQRSAPALRLSARSNSRIPDDRFSSNFGRRHEFRMGNPQMVGGFSRFQYGGYWFGFVQPWPVGWYYTDDVYVDYIDGGYYLCNPSYPNARLSISVVL